MPSASMPQDNPLFAWLDSLTYILTEHPLRVSGPFGDFDVEYHLDIDDPNDPDGAEYALIGFMLPDDERILAEIENAYGVMTGIRIYLDREED